MYVRVMDAGTLVALVIGLASLLVTVVLDGRNRKERRETASQDSEERSARDVAEREERHARERAERAERERERWIPDRRAVYARYLEGVQAQAFAIGHRIADLYRSGAGGEGDPADGFPSGEDYAGWEEAARDITLLAPSAVARPCKEAEALLRELQWTTLMMTVSRSPEIGQPEVLQPIADQHDQLQALIDEVRLAMRADLRVDFDTGA